MKEHNMQVREPLHFEIEYFNILIFLEAKDIEIEIVKKESPRKARGRGRKGGVGTNGNPLTTDPNPLTTNPNPLIINNNNNPNNNKKTTTARTRSKFKIQYETVVQNCLCTYIYNNEEQKVYKSEYCLDELPTEVRLVFASIEDFFDYIAREHQSDAVKITRAGNIVVDYPDAPQEDPIKLPNEEDPDIDHIQFQQKCREAFRIYQAFKSMDRQMKTNIGIQRDDPDGQQQIIVSSQSHPSEEEHYQVFKRQESAGDYFDEDLQLDLQGDDFGEENDNENQENEENENNVLSKEQHSEDKVLLQHQSNSHMSSIHYQSSPEQLKYQINDHEDGDGDGQRERGRESPLQREIPIIKEKLERLDSLISAFDGIKLCNSEITSIKDQISHIYDKIEVLAISVGKQESSLHNAQKMQKEILQICQGMKTNTTATNKNKNTNKKNNKQQSEESQQVVENQNQNENEELELELEVFDREGWPGSLQMYREEYIEVLKRKHSLKSEKQLEQICILSWRRLSASERDEYQRKFTKKLTDFFLRGKSENQPEPEPISKPILQKQHRKTKKQLKAQKIQNKKVVKKIKP